MYDTTCEQSFINVREWIQSINEITDRSIPIIIIGMAKKNHMMAGYILFKILYKSNIHYMLVLKFITFKF